MIFTQTIKFKKAFILFALICAETLILAFAISAQDIEVKIKLLPQARVFIEEKILNKALLEKRISFLDHYADVSNLGLRIENLKVFDEKDNEIESKKISSAEFQANQIPASLKYEINAAISQTITDAAHVSWISGNQGLLMLNDLLPRFSSTKPVSARVTFELSEKWKISTSETPVGENIYDVKNHENAIFLVGNNWREKSIRVDKTNVYYATAGNRAFSDDDAAEMIDSILSEHKNIFGEIPAGKVQIILLSFPQSDASADRWRAETRGSTVTIISGEILQKNAALQRLHEQLRHEILHLWLPNAVNLSGNYAWFYEGFTIYQALRTGVKLNQIRFEDYLNTLSRAYDIVRRDSKGQTFSLIEASQARWAGANNYIYAKGLLVAFLCDVVLLRKSKGKRGVDAIFRTVFQKHRTPAQSQDGNLAITGILKSYPELVSITRNYIEGNAELQWQEYLESAGLLFDSAATTQIKVGQKLNGRQKDLLNDLGYNQWRKLLQKKK